MCDRGRQEARERERERQALGYMLQKMFITLENFFRFRSIDHCLTGRWTQRNKCVFLVIISMCCLLSQTPFFKVDRLSKGLNG